MDLGTDPCNWPTKIKRFPSHNYFSNANWAGWTFIICCLQVGLKSPLTCRSMTHLELDFNPTASSTACTFMTKPCNASFICLALDLVNGPSIPCRGSLRLLDHVGFISFPPSLKGFVLESCSSPTSNKDKSATLKVELTWKIKFISIVINLLNHLEWTISSWL